MLWRRPKQDPTVKTPAELQERTDQIVEALRTEAKRAKIVTSIITDRVSVLEAHRAR